MNEILQLDESHEGFCVVEDWNQNYNEFLFHFHRPVVEETHDKFHNFLKNNDLEIILRQERENYIRFFVNLTSETVSEFASLYDSIKKYNL
jgi:hypothetical protein